MEVKEETATGRSGESFRSPSTARVRLFSRGLGSSGVFLGPGCGGAYPPPVTPMGVGPSAGKPQKLGLFRSGEETLFSLQVAVGSWGLDGLFPPSVRDCPLMVASRNELHYLKCFLPAGLPRSPTSSLGKRPGGGGPRGKRPAQSSSTSSPSDSSPPPLPAPRRS